MTHLQRIIKDTEEAIKEDGLSEEEVNLLAMYQVQIIDIIVRRRGSDPDTIGLGDYDQIVADCISEA